MEKILKILVNRKKIEKSEISRKKSINYKDFIKPQKKIQKSIFPYFPHFPGKTSEKI